MADRVMVVGGSGFIGSHLSKRLVERGDLVINYDIRPWAGELDWMMSPYKEGIIYETGSVENWPQLGAVVRQHRVNKIVHAAAPINLAYLG